LTLTEYYCAIGCTKKTAENDFNHRLIIIFATVSKWWFKLLQLVAAVRLIRDVCSTTYL